MSFSSLEKVIFAERRGGKTSATHRREKQVRKTDQADQIDQIDEIHKSHSIVRMDFTGNLFRLWRPSCSLPRRHPLTPEQGNGRSGGGSRLLTNVNPLPFPNRERTVDDRREVTTVPSHRLRMSPLLVEVHICRGHWIATVASTPATLSFPPATAQKRQIFTRYKLRLEEDPAPHRMAVVEAKHLSCAALVRVLTPVRNFHSPSLRLLPLPYRNISRLIGVLRPFFSMGTRSSAYKKKLKSRSKTNFKSASCTRYFPSRRLVTALQIRRVALGLLPVSREFFVPITKMALCTFINPVDQSHRLPGTSMHFRSALRTHALPARCGPARPESVPCCASPPSRWKLSTGTFREQNETSAGGFPRVPDDGHAHKYTHTHKHSNIET